MTDQHFFANIRARVEAQQRWEAEHPEEAAARRKAFRAQMESQMESEKQAEDEKRAAQAREATWEALRDVGMPRRALAALQHGMRQTEAIQRFKAPGDGAFLLSGPPGTGKTVAAVHEAHRRMTEAMTRSPERTRENPWRTALFARAVTCARGSAYGPEAEGEIQRLTTTRFLILDDLGSEYASPVWDMLLFEILDTRHGDMLPTVITTNLGGDALRTRYGDRLAERIREGGAVVYLDGKSMRGAQ